MKSFASACDYLGSNRPAEPVICHRPHAVVCNARWFLEHFPGDVLYAIKANPSPMILRSLYDAGIRHFDVSSPAELDSVHSLFPDARAYCMNPVKHPDHIREAYFEFGVRDFALDSRDELDKILAATANARDLRLHVRIAVDNSRSRIPLASKYGIRPSAAPNLLVAARLVAEELGVCFHVGSQSMQPESYADAIERANRLIRRAGVILDSVDVGGGFPAAYPGMSPEPLEVYVKVIREAFDESLTSWTCRLLCEPGRALVADSASLLVNVVLRKGRSLYINDGAYGTLFDAAHLKFPYPVRAIRDGQWHETGRETPFRFFGPTCDSIDVVPGPFMLPADLRAGDYIEIGQIGAYGDTMRTNFNGFGTREEVIVADAPMLALRLQESSTPEPEFNTGD